jgi:phosphoribosyl-AMP cyclohydrolase/phosphoribosyl-ATP pyrophosphohydrolase/phosphoribosyl-AMP cyclohydrolase
MPVGTPIAATEDELARIKYDDHGLVPAVIQEEGTGQVLMVGYMNAATLRETLESGRAVFWSRSRQEVWRKGDTSGDRMWVREAYFDCDGDTLLFVVEQEGKGACHTGERSCFYRAFGAEGADPSAPES